MHLSMLLPFLILYIAFIEVETKSLILSEDTRVE